MSRSAQVCCDGGRVRQWWRRRHRNNSRRTAIFNRLTSKLYHCHHHHMLTAAAAATATTTMASRKLRWNASVPALAAGYYCSRCSNVSWLLYLGISTWRRQVAADGTRLSAVRLLSTNARWSRRDGMMTLADVPCCQTIIIYLLDEY